MPDGNENYRKHPEPMTWMPPTFMTILRDILQNRTPNFRVVWKSAQWDSQDGTDEELWEMFKAHGSDATVEIGSTVQGPIPEE